MSRDRKSKNALVRTMRSIGWSDDGARFMASHADDPRIARFIGKLEKMPAPMQCIAQPGYIYLVGGNGVYKIGKSRDIPSRMRSFLQLPFKTRLIHSIPTSDMVWAENYLHRAFAHCRMNGEWFDLEPHEVDWICGLTTLNPDR